MVAYRSDGSFRLHGWSQVPRGRSIFKYYNHSDIMGPGLIGGQERT